MEENQTLVMSMKNSSIDRISQDLSKVQLVKSGACPPPKCSAILEIVVKRDSMGVLSLILPKVIMIHDVRSCYMCIIGEVRDYKIREACKKSCNEETFNNEFQTIERKGLTRVLEFLWNFIIKWIKVILSKVHDMKYWLKNELVEITKKMIHKGTCYPTLDKKKPM